MVNIRFRIGRGVSRSLPEKDTDDTHIDTLASHFCKSPDDENATLNKGVGIRKTVQQESTVNGSESSGWARRGLVPALREFFRRRSGLPAYVIP